MAGDWNKKQSRDPFVRRAKAEHKRSRAVFKLTEILQRFVLLPKEGAVVIDLGCAPGSWCAELRSYTRGGILVGIDILAMEAMHGLNFVCGDISETAIQQQLDKLLAGRKADLVVSDMAPNLCGNKIADQARMIYLNELSLHLACQYLRNDGSALFKTFQGAGLDEFRQQMRSNFNSLRNIKPQASRKKSAEFYLLGHKYAPTLT
ncbi:MAG: RlmE family RNA methyltransferase [Mariprofundales bacterium]